MPPPFADSAVTQSGYLHSGYAQGFASQSPLAATAHISPQVIPDLEPHIITRISTLHAHDDTLDQNILLPMEISRCATLLLTDRVLSRELALGSTDASSYSTPVRPGLLGSAVPDLLRKIDQR